MLHSDNWGLLGRKTAPGEVWGECGEARRILLRQMGSVFGQSGKGGQTAKKEDLDKGGRRGRKSAQLMDFWVWESCMLLVRLPHLAMPIE